MAGLGPLGKVAEVAEGLTATIERVPALRFARRAFSLSSLMSAVVQDIFIFLFGMFLVDAILILLATKSFKSIVSMPFLNIEWKF